MAELGQVWKNTFGSLASLVKEEEGKISVEVKKGSQMSFSSFSVLLGQVQNEIKSRLFMDMSLQEDGSLLLSIKKESSVIEEITGIQEEAPIAKKRAKKEEVEDAISTEKGE